jgi:hypothetical protein
MQSNEFVISKGDLIMNTKICSGRKRELPNTAEYFTSAVHMRMDNSHAASYVQLHQTVPGIGDVKKELTGFG